MDDLISRRAAVEKLTSNLTYMRTFGADRSIDLIEELPSVEPKKGKWIYTGEDDGNGNAYCNCSICGAGESHSRQVKVRYCWNCGAKMEGEEE